jgi:hypothetical protein
VIDGLSLGFALEDDLQDKLLAIALACRSVVSLSSSPLPLPLIPLLPNLEYHHKFPFSWMDTIFDLN